LKNKGVENVWRSQKLLIFSPSRLASGSGIGTQKGTSYIPFGKNISGPLEWSMILNT